MPLLATPSVLLTLLMSAGPAASSAVDDLRPGHQGMLVDLNDSLDDAAVQAFASRWHLTLAPGSEFTAQDRTYLLPDADPALIRALRADPDVEVAEPNMVYGLSPLEQVPAAEAPPAEKLPKGYPDDPLFKSQWHMTMIGMPEAWQRSQGKGVVVAVIDTGVSDGKGKLPRVPDMEGVSFVPGYDFVHDNRQPDDDHAHGTHVAGTIAQRTHNGFGVAGVAPQASIMPLKVLSKQGWGTASDIAAAIRWAADHGAHVINMSLGGGGYSDAMARAVKYAHDKGVVVVCAAGNTGRGRVEYPAAYPGAVAVSALGPDGSRAWYSSYGKEVFVAAPGGDTRVDLNKDGIADGVLQDTIAPGDPKRHGFFPFQGTSMATPHVAGVAALIRARGVTHPDKIAAVIADSAQKRDDRKQYGHGALNAAEAMRQLDQQQAGRGAFAALLVGGMVLAARRRRHGMVVALGWRGVLAATVAGAGLFPLQYLGADSAWANVLSQPLWMWDAALWGGPSLVAASALIPLAAAAALLGVKRWQGALAGLALGTAAALLYGAGASAVDVTGVPGMGLLDSVWLGVQGMFALGLGWLLLRR